MVLEKDRVTVVFSRHHWDVGRSMKKWLKKSESYIRKTPKEPLNMAFQPSIHYKQNGPMTCLHISAKQQNAR